MSLREVRQLPIDDDLSVSAILLMSCMLALYPDQRLATTGEGALWLAATT